MRTGSQICCSNIENKTLGIESSDPIMECLWKSSSTCLKLFKAIQHTNPIVNMTFDEQGVHIMAMGRSPSSLVQLFLTPKSFHHYSCATPITIGVRTATMVTILQKAKQNELVWKALDQMALSIILFKDDQHCEFRLRAVEIEEEQFDMPELNDNVLINVESNALREWTEKVLMAESDVLFQISQSKFLCSSSSIELGKVIHSEPMDGKRIKTVAFREHVNMALSFQATQSMLIFSNCGEMSTIGFSNHQPSRLKVQLGDGSYLSLYVAPKNIDDE